MLIGIGEEFKTLLQDLIFAEDGLPVREVNHAADKDGESEGHHNDVIIDETPLCSIIIIFGR